MHSFKVSHPDDTEHPWTYCDCKQMAARWQDPNAGTVQVLAMVPEHAFIIGMNNNFLRAAVSNPKPTNEDWQKAHAWATLAPDHIFDAHRRGCWACVIRVGETTDIHWHPGQERIKAGEAIADVLFQPVRIKVNSVEVVWKHRTLTYKDIVELAGHDSTKGTIYTISVYVKGKEGFCPSPGDTVLAEANMIISCHYTGNA